MGKVHYVDKPYWPHNTCLYVTDFLGNNPRFAYYLLQTLDFSGYNSGSAQPSLNRNLIYEMRVVVPDRAEQDRIAEILGLIDDRIGLVQRNAVALEEVAHVVFKSWFVNFDPVRAKAEGRDPEYLDAGTAALFPTEFDMSEIGPIPRGWRVQTLGDVFDLNPRRDLPRGADATYLDMQGTPTVGHRPLSLRRREFGSGVKFTNGDTLLARITPCLENGKTAFVDFLEDGEVGWGSTEFVVLRPKPPLPPFFGYLLARDHRFRAYAIRSMSGSSGRQRVDVGSLAQYRFAVPDTPVAEAFGRLVEPLRARVAANCQMQGTLASLRDTLLPRLISGKLRIPEAEEALKEVL